MKPFIRLTQVARARWLVPLLISLVCLLGGRPLQAAAPAEQSPGFAAEVELPAELGTIVYRTPGASSSTIYIIANGHRSALSGANQPKVLQAQIETFRIGEWLLSRNRIALLLPEGFFGEMVAVDGAEADSRRLDSRTLQTALTDTTHFVNAELLLHEKYGIGLEQVEDRQLYLDVRDRFASSRRGGGDFSFTLFSELAYLQKLRTASMLQTAPTVIAAAYRQGRIAAPNAMMTIGLDHLQDMIAFLQAGEIDMAGLRTAERFFPPQHGGLELFKRQVGVMVIVPRALLAEEYPVQRSS